MEKESLKYGFTLIEMLVVISIIALLSSLIVPAVQSSLERAKITESSSNIRQLALANLNYAVDHRGRFARAQEIRNLTRWHGGRASTSDPFDPGTGYLSPYLGGSGRVKMCPLLLAEVEGSDSWEDGTGGYGYNAAYIGGTPQDRYTPATAASIPTPVRTVMFTTTGFARAEGVQEYAYTEPYQWVDTQGNLRGNLQPSTHFRANGKAVVAWADGHVSLERPNGQSGPNYYGGDNELELFGWFGPTDHNGYWNPLYPH